MKMSGVPRSDKEFIERMQEHSCNPVACRRILIVLHTEGVKYVTVMAELNFVAIAEDLADMGVTLEITPPVDSNPQFGSNADQVALDLALGKVPNTKYFSEAEVEEGYRRARLVGIIESETLGPYSHFARR